MHYRFFPLLVLLVGMAGCSSSEEQTIETLVEDYADSRSDFQDLQGVEYLQAYYDQLLEENGPASTYAYGEIENNEDHYRLFSYAYRISEVTDFDFVQLATVQYQHGLSGVDDVIAHMDSSDEGYEEARHFESLHWLTSSLYEAEATSYLDDLVDPSLSPEDQQALYLQTFAEAWDLMVYDSPASVKESVYSEASLCAQATNLDFETLAIIQYKGGTYGLELTIQRFPDLEGKEACLSTLGLET